MTLSRRTFAASAAAAAVATASWGGGSRRARAAGPVKIGVLTDMNGPLSAVLGAGSVDGARMAIEDFGGSAAGMPVQLLYADHQNKAVTQYLKAIRATGSKDTDTVTKALREMPVDDAVTRGGRVRIDGRLVRPTYLLEVKPKAQVKEGYDVFTVSRTIPGSEAFRPLSESACPLVKT